MGYFDDCCPDRRLLVYRWTAGFDFTTICIITDWDERRTISVEVERCQKGRGHDDNFFVDALAKCIDTLPADAVAIRISPDGELLSTSCNPDDDETEVANYFPRSDYPPELPTVRRSDLTEHERRCIDADLVSYQAGPDRRMAVFKYFVAPNNFATMWHEIHFLSRIPAHPHIVSFDSLIVDSTDGGEGKVVGFTTKYVPGGMVQDHASRVFKLKYLCQLLETVDYLNLKLGIVQGDMYPFNILIDEEADNLVIYGFSRGAKLGWDGDPHTHWGYNPDRDDVKHAIFLLYEIITLDVQPRDGCYLDEQDAPALLALGEWKQHPAVQPDAPVAAYRALLEAWVARRQAPDSQLPHYTQAPEHKYLDWPGVPPLPEVDWYGRRERVRSRLRQTLLRSGEKFLEWQRPPSRALPLPKGKRLLATGEVVDEHDGESVFSNCRNTTLARL